MKFKLANIMSVVLTHDFRKYVKVLNCPPDITFIGRIATPPMYLFQKFLKKKNTKVIFDLDDSLFLYNANFLGINLRSGSFFLESIIKKADLVTVNGHYLYDYAHSLNRNTVIIHDPIDTELFHPQRNKLRKRKLTLGWEGVPKNHYDNLAILIEPLAKLSQEYNLKFKLVSSLGDHRIKQMFKPLEKAMEIDYGQKQWLPISRFAKSLSDFDILLSPLQKTLWCEGKSALRVGIGMALGIPVVASPVGEQKYLVKQGATGFLAANETDWYTYLKKLLDNAKMRKEMGERGREVVKRELSLDSVSKKLLCSLESLMKT
jgi:L-malate glycosyltransferase